MPKKSTTTMKTRRTSGSSSKLTAKAKATTSRTKKHVGDVLGIGRARVADDAPRASTKRGGRRPKGIELPRLSRSGLKRARVVGGVRGRGR